MLVACALLLTKKLLPTPTITVPFTIAQSAIVVSAQVNGHSVSLLFDTGFGGDVVVNNTVDIGETTGQTELRDFVGQFTADTVKVKSLTLGGLNVARPGMEAIKQPSMGLTEVFGRHIDGILGLSALMHRVFTIDFQHQRFEFYPPSYKLSGIGKKPLSSELLTMLPIGADSIDLAVTPPSGKEMIMALDTGNAFYATTHKDVLERVGIWTDSQKPKYLELSGVASGAVTSWYLEMPPMNIFGIPVSNTIWDVIDLPSSEAEGDGTVGFGFLRHFNITIDFPERLVLLQKWDLPIENQPDGNLGISAGYSRSQHRIVVELVAPNSPAAVAGIEKHDQILAIDGRNLGEVPFLKLRSLFNGPVGSKVTIDISRDGEFHRFEVVRKALINNVKS